MAVNGIDESGPCDSRGSFSRFPSGIIDAYVSECAEHIADNIGASNIMAIFLCGSFALDEGGIGLDGEKPQLVGDIDLLVVMKDLDVLSRFRKRRGELGRSCEKLTDGIEFTGRVDIGMMLPEDLERMPPRPGVFDLKTRGRTLFGDAGTLDLIPDYDAAQIGGREAVILLENRVASLLGLYGTWSASSDEFPYPFVYEIARVYTDVATALIALSGLYVAGYEKRSELFARADQCGDLAVRVDREISAEIESWTRFKLRPSRRLIGSCSEGDLRMMWEEAARRVLDCWAICEAHVQGDECRTRNVSGLLAFRKASVSPRESLISWREFLADRPLWSRIRCLAGLGWKVLEKDPASHIREIGVRLLDIYLRGNIGETSERIPGLFRRTWSSWEEAARDLFSGWREAVYGRRDT
jgi:hypothetical protein